MAQAQSDVAPAPMDPGNPPAQQAQNTSNPASCGAQSTLANCVFGQFVMVGMTFQWDDQVDASEQGSTQTSVATQPQKIQITTSHQHIDTVTVNDTSGTQYTLDKPGSWSQQTTATGNYDWTVSNSNNVTVTVNFSLHLDPTKAEFGDRASLNFVSTQLTVYLGVGINNPDGSSGLTYSDPNTGGRLVNAIPNFRSGDWSVNFTTAAPASEAVKYNSHLQTFPGGPFSYTGAPQGKYGETVGFTWSFSVTLNT